MTPLGSLRRAIRVSYSGPFYRSMWDVIGTLAYELALPPQLSHRHIVLHILMLKKYVTDPQYVIDFHILKR